MEQRQRIETEIQREQRQTLERDWTASRDFLASQHDAGDDQRAQCGFGPFAEAK